MNHKNKRLEIYGTLGPSCRDERTLSALFETGMTGVRLNLSHSDLDGCGEWLSALRAAASHAGVVPELLIDLKGPELRVGELPAPVELREGENALLGGAGIPVPSIIFPSLKAGQEILLDDGVMQLRVVQSDTESAECVVVRGGLLKGRKSIAIPGADIHPPTLAPSDRYNLSLATGCGVTGVMLPFVRDAEDLKELRRALSEAGASNIRVFAKLENMAGVEALPSLLEEADHIVIARGDLGNDMPLWKLPAVQKRVSALCREAGKPFMVVTQMLHSMQEAAVPTRAEVSDIFNAVLDGASSLMLTGETAAGKYPVEAMRCLCETAKEAEVYLTR